MKSIARRMCWWTRLDSDIGSYVHNCGNCEAMTAVLPPPSIHPWEWPEKLCVRIHVDFAGPIKGQMYLIVIDSYSKWLEIIPTDSATAEVSIRALLEIMSNCGLPLMMVSHYHYRRRIIRPYYVPWFSTNTCDVSCEELLLFYIMCADG